MNLAAYSSWTVPGCCPDLHFNVKWNWNGAQFQETPSALFGPVPVLIQATPSASQIRVGQTLTYTVKVSNTGSIPLSQTTVGGVAIQPDTGQDSPDCKAASYCTIGTLQPGATVTVILQVTVTQPISPHIFRFNVNGVYPISGTVNVHTQSSITVT